MRSGLLKPLASLGDPLVLALFAVARSAAFVESDFVAAARKANGPHPAFRPSSTSATVSPILPQRTAATRQVVGAAQPSTAPDDLPVRPKRSAPHRACSRWAALGRSSAIISWVYPVVEPTLRPRRRSSESMGSTPGISDARSRMVKLNGQKSAKRRSMSALCGGLHALLRIDAPRRESPGCR